MHSSANMAWINISWQPHDDQPYSLFARQALAHITQNKDEALRPLMSGIQPATSRIPRSNVFIPHPSPVQMLMSQVCKC